MKKLTQEEFDAMTRDERGYINIPDETDCTVINFHGTDKIVFGKFCTLGNWFTLGNWCTLGDGCTLGNDCKLGDCCTLGDNCKLGDGCTLGNDCKLGDCCTLGDWFTLGNWCTLGDGCTLGNDCKLGDCCTLGDWCTLGKRCELGDWCNLGEYCKLGEFCSVRATFEGGGVKNGLYVQVGNIGSEHRTAYFYIDGRGAMFVRAGCWFSGMDDFKTRVHSVHGGTIYEAQYMAACQYAETVLPMMLKADNERRARNANESETVSR